MNKNEFLKRLDSRLMGMPKEDREDAINYYKEYFIDAGVEDNQDVIPIVGTPEKAARKIIDECTDKTLNEQKKYGGAKNNAKLLWLVILGIFAAPIAFPIALIICAVVFSVIIAVVAVLAALFVVGAILFLGWNTILPKILPKGCLEKLNLETDLNKQDKIKIREIENDGKNDPNKRIEGNQL